MSDWSGLIWQHPAYGFTALAVLIPIIIHLLNRSRGKLVTFAHVALLRSTAPKPTYELRLSQRLLLLIRLLLLVLAALLLSQPWWPSAGDKQESILVSIDWLNSSSPVEKQQLATRLGEQTAILLDSPLMDAQQKLDAQAILNWSSQTLRGPLNLWAKINSHATALSRQSTLIIYATNRASQYQGNQVAIHQPLDWQIKKLDSAALSTQTLSIVVIYQGDRQQDADAITAAIAALQRQSLADISVSQTTQNDFEQSLVDKPLSAAQLVWWLSSAPVPAQLLHGPSTPKSIVIDAPGGESQLSWQADFADQLFSEVQGSRLSTSSNPAFDSLHSEVLWQTSQGLSLLSRFSSPEVNLLQFYARFNPLWSNATSLASFPLLLAEILHIALPAVKPGSEVLDPGQIEQLALSSAAAPPGAVTAMQSAASPNKLNAWLALLLVVVFAIERLYSEKTRRLTGARPDRGQA